MSEEAATATEEAPAPVESPAAGAPQEAPAPESTGATGTLLGTDDSASPPSTDPATDPWVADGKFTAAFYDQIGSDDVRGIVEKYQGDPLKAMTALKEAQSLIGKRFTVPGKESDPAILSKFREVNGIPDAPEGYNIEPPENLPEGVEYNQEQFLQHYAPLFHELNLTPAQAKAIISRHIEVEGMRAQEMGKHNETQSAAYLAEQKAELERSFGSHYTENIASAQRFAQTLGVDLNDPVIGNNAALIKAFAKGAAFISPDKLVPPAQVATAQSLAAQAKDIQTNKENPEHLVYLGQAGSREEQVAVQKKVRDFISRSKQE